MFRHILVPTDASPLSRGAALHAIALARTLGAQLTFVHALPQRPLPYFGGEGGMFVDQVEPDEFDATARRAAEQHLADLAALAREAGIASAGLIESGAAPYEIVIQIADARGCDLILMASHGHMGIKAMILGSQTQKVLTHTRIPVLVFR